MTPSALRALSLVVAIVLVVGTSTPARGQTSVVGKAVRETLEICTRKFGREAAREGTEALTRRLTAAIGRYGDDAARAVQRTGPQGLRLVEEAGEHGAAASRLLSRHGDEALAAAGRPAALKLVARHGDEAGLAVVRHAGVAEPVIAAHGEQAAKALVSLGPKEGRRLGMMFEAKELARIGRTDELLAVVAKFGDAGMNFVWANKAALAVSATLAAFLADPGAFISGAKDLAAVALDTTVKPLAESAGRAVERAAADIAPAVAAGTHWTAVFVAAVLAATALVGCRIWLSRPSSPTTASHPECPR